MCACACACAFLALAVLGAGELESGVRVAAVTLPPAIGVGEDGGFVVGGRPAFLIGLSNPPPLSGRTPAGVSGPVEVVRAGVNLLRVGPTWTGWTRRELGRALAWQRVAVRLGVHTWVRLNAFAATHPRWLGDARLATVVHALTRSRFAAGLGLWQGADEPWSRGIPARSLAFVYCRLTARDRSACAGEPPLDRRHLVEAVLAPRGTATELAPYRNVADSLGVDVYPVTLGDAGAPSLHEVGIWTREIGAIARDHSVETTLQICATHAYNERTGAYVLPSAYQERYMVFDAIVNGARGVAFFGGGNPHCWNRRDRRYGWNWSFWNRVLDPLIEQISSPSALGAALDNAASNDHLETNDPGTEAVGRVGAARPQTQLWVIAARSGAGVKRVVISGLPRSVRFAAVYGERRFVRVRAGRLSDDFRPWQVHIYRIRAGSPRHGRSAR